VNKNNKKHQHRKLELKKDTIVHLTDDRLKVVVGGNEGQIASWPFQSCETQCEVREAV
jgi:hypothetical protein